MSLPNFVGVYFYSMDSKNRLAVPAKMRLAMGETRGMILSCGLEGCLSLYLGEAWRKLNARLEEAPLNNRMEQRAFKRMLYASACEVDFDDEGRILLPQHLADYAQMKREAAIIGVGEKIEIWAKERWSAYQKREARAFTRHASRLEI
ncbi:MAG: division/cell wall cluster transcriptional repressor MraZ [Elusimicrobia bacterium RIFCSPLOWO2_01_FULL_64_13]|nr:MAG: division/cell wall cluster transcriptional repressor MraZ [Elusimicrobia bacterium RIFCSPLOWO2_01_FULL_64_13]